MKKRTKKLLALRQSIGFPSRETVDLRRNEVFVLLFSSEKEESLEIIPTALACDTSKASRPFLKKRTKKLLSMRTATAWTKVFCFFFQKKKALPCFGQVSLQGGWYKSNENSKRVVVRGVPSEPVIVGRAAIELHTNRWWRGKAPSEEYVADLGKQAGPITFVGDAGAEGRL